MSGHDLVSLHWSAGQLRLHALLLMEWRRSGISIAKMAAHLGKSQSLVKKMKSSTTPVSARTFNQIVAILGLDPIRMYHAAFVMEDIKGYYAPDAMIEIDRSLTRLRPLLDQVDDTILDRWLPPHLKKIPRGG